MNLRILGSVLSLIFLFVTVCAGKESVSDAEIHAAITKMGAQAGDDSHDPAKLFEVFYRNPEQATRILISELKPTTRGHYRSDKHPQAVWIVRALRSLTGLDFRAATTADLTPDEAHFLDSDGQGKVLFFGTWMSRDAVWVAPRDAQIAIIKKWQEWFATKGHDHTYVIDRNFDHWFF